MATITTNGTTRTATVYVRHSDDCKDAAQGPQHRKCNCRKWLLLYDGATKEQTKAAAKTRSWSEAENAANTWIDQFDPIKAELTELTAVKAAQAVKIEDAVAAYLKDMIARLGDNGTVKRNRGLLEIKLNAWLAVQPNRPQLISEVTPTHLMDWRASWKFGSDLTAAIGFDAVKTFFKFCVGQGWIALSPAANIKRPKIKRGNRTATFSDEQYAAILAAAHGNQRLETFLELLRWSGMAIIDGVLFDRKMLGDDGVLRFARRKSGSLSTVKLPDHVVALLRSVQGGSQPFLRTDILLNNATHEWRRELQSLFTKAGILKVQTEVGSRRPHPHMLRDTCAVWFLRNGVGIHSVSKLLGHSNVAITSKHYAPWVKELETAHIAELGAALDAAKVKPAGKLRAIR